MVKICTAVVAVGDVNVVISINGNEFVVAVEYGAGRVVLVANEWPFYNPGSGYRIDYEDNEQLVGNIWEWLLE